MKTYNHARNRLMFTASFVFLLALTSAVIAEDARVAHIFQDNMVLQRGMPVPVWGWAAAGTPVEVSFAGQTKKAVTNKDGRWEVKLDAMEASTKGRPLTIKIGEKTVTRKDVLVGEVWIAAGQSNMNHGGPDYDTGLYPHYTSPGTAGGKPEMRTIRFGSGASLEPLKDVDPMVKSDQPWKTIPEPIKSANMAAYFARIVRDATDVPIGIVHVAVSGTNQAAWMSKETLEQFSGGKEKNFYEQFKAAAEAKTPWEKFAKAQAEWRETKKGRWPGNSRIVNYPTALYNTRVHPLAPFAVRGVIWHQGEGGPGGPYGERLIAMAKQWRKLFGQDFYFIWGTLGRHTADSPPLKPIPSWFYRSNTNLSMRQGLKLAADDPKITMVEISDAADYTTHFHNKAEAGRRMGLAALTLAYGKNHIFSGPILKEVKIDGSKAIVTFDRVGEGLKYEPSIDGISGFYIKDKAGPYRWADVKVVDKKTIELSHGQIKEIAELGYAVNANPHETLFNSAGLPSSPFRWKMARLPWSGHAKGGSLLQITPGGRKIEMNLAHVRRKGYVFQLFKGRNAKDVTEATVDAYVPKEWSDAAVLVGGKPVQAEKINKDGTTYMKFTAPVDGTWVVIAEKGQESEFAKIKRY